MKPPAPEIRKPEHTHYIADGELFWTGHAWLSSQTYAASTYARTYTHTGAKIAAGVLRRARSYPKIKAIDWDAPVVATPAPHRQ